MKRLLILLFLCLSANAGAQQDSLFTAFDAAKSTDDRLIIAYDITKKYVASYPEKVLKYLKMAVKDSTKAKDRASLGLCLNGMSVCYYFLGDSKNSGNYARKAIKVLKNTDEELGLQKARKNLALSLDDQGQYKEALKVYFELLTYYKAKGDSVSAAGMLNDIGNIYIKTKNYKEAFDYQLEALRFINPYPDGEQTKGNILNSIGYIYDEKKQQDSAIYYYEQALVIKRNAGGLVSMNNTLNNLCTCIDYKAFPEKSITCVTELLSTQIALGDAKGIIRSYINLSVTYNSLGACEKAVDNLKQASTYTSTIDDLPLLTELYKTYSQALYGCGDYKKAYEIREQFENYNDSLLNLGKQEALLELNEKYASKQKEEQIKLLNVQQKSDQLLIQKQQRTLWIIILAVTLSTILSYFLFYRFKENQKRKRENDLLKQREEDRLRIARDMHDEIGSGLTRVTMRSQQLGKNIQEGKPADTQFSESLSKISEESRQLSRNIGEIIWALNPKNDNLDSFIAYLRNYVYDYLEEAELECILHFPEELAAVPIAPDKRRDAFLIVKEALNNIMKHAKATRVTVELSCNNGELKIDISDNGCGIDQQKQSEGNGLLNMQKRCEGSGGSFTLQSEVEKGTHLLIRLPDFLGTNTY